MATVYIHFTEEQKEQARCTDLVDLLRGQGEKLVRSGSEYSWRHSGEHITLRGNLWYNQYGQYGGDAIEFVRTFYDLDFPKAVQWLLEQKGSLVIAQGKEKTREQRPFSLPPKNRDMRRAYAYLLKTRLLDREVVEYFMRSGLIYEDVKYHNVVFVGRDEEGIARHAHKRGTCFQSAYKGNVESSDPRFSFHYIGTGPNLYIFEAPIDMLSYISLHKQNWKESSYVSLCSVAAHAAVYILQHNPQINTVIPCLDHDPAGIEGVYRIAEEVQRLGTYQLRPEQPRFKDWNEDMRGQHGQKPIPASEHTGVIRMKLFCRELTQQYYGEKCPSYPLEYLRDAYRKLAGIPETHTKSIWEQSWDMAGTAFLLAKKRLETMGKEYSEKQYEQLLFQQYAPQHDHAGYAARMAEMKYKLESLSRSEWEQEVLPETVCLEQVQKVFSLSADCLRLFHFVEQQEIERQKKQCLSQQGGMVYD